MADTPIVRFEGRNESDFEGQWVAAKDLKAGYKCLLANGKTAIITGTWVEELAEPETTYNIEVEGAHTYFVGKNGILVHNACPTTPDGRAVYRGGDNMTANPNELKMVDGMVMPKKGISVNVNPSELTRFGSINQIGSLPDGLSIVQRGVNLAHFEIIPSYAMPLNQYQSLLNQIRLIPFI